MTKGMLCVVATPIGNLEDITLRAVRVLKESDLIAAEDTRKTATLLSNYDISTPSTSYHSYNLKAKTPTLITKLLNGQNIALVSDSGTPGISDPGSVLISESIKKDITVTIIPGASAVISALVVSGKPTNKFVFEGFLSNKKGRRQKQLEGLKDEKRTVIIYESPHRIVKFLEDFLEVMGDKELVIARELTKKFEEIKRGEASLLLDYFSNNKPRGEFVIIF
ncbi:MAG: 16S rRNA (cytidine(1402)-2'-O)-methyltransferase [Candidatus Omnitrophica bacterium]|nr:16S rRNA (cytidine(1402)-2'-O)-methyltransferase [Candidatus Omnitrophota bacterium]